MDVDGEEEAEQTVHLTLANITSLTKLLQAIKVGAKQVVRGARALQHLNIQQKADLASCRRHAA